MALVGAVPSGLPSFEVPDLGLMWDHSASTARRRRGTGADRVLPDRGRCQGVRDEASLPGGRQPGDGRAGDGQRRRGPAAGDAGHRPASRRARSTTTRARRSGLASLTSGVIVLLTLLFLAPVFSDLPKPVLAALIIEAVVMGMMDLPELRRLARVQRFDFWVAITAIVGTLAFGVLAGVVFGIGLSLLWLIAVTTRPALPLLGRRAGYHGLPRAVGVPRRRAVPGVAVIRPEGGLFFATSDALDERVREVIQQTPDVTCLVLDCSAISFVDSQGVAQLGEIVTIDRGGTGHPAAGQAEARRPRHAGARRRPHPDHGSPDPRQRGRRRTGPARDAPGGVTPQVVAQPPEPGWCGPTRRLPSMWGPEASARRGLGGQHGRAPRRPRHGSGQSGHGAGPGPGRVRRDLRSRAVLGGGCRRGPQAAGGVRTDPDPRPGRHPSGTWTAGSRRWSRSCCPAWRRSRASTARWAAC